MTNWLDNFDIDDIFGSMHRVRYSTAAELGRIPKFFKGSAQASVEKYGCAYTGMYCSKHLFYTDKMVIGRNCFHCETVDIAEDVPPSYRRGKSIRLRKSGYCAPDETTNN